MSPAIQRAILGLAIAVIVAGEPKSICLGSSARTLPPCRVVSELRFYQKPARFDLLPRLTSTVKAMSLTTVTDSVIKRLMARAQELYSLPSVVVRVLELTQTEPVDIPALRGVIERDPALTVKLLRIANSSYFGMRSEVTELNQALALLGCRMVKVLVLSFSLPPDLLRDVEAKVLERYWRTAVYRAVTARRIALVMGKPLGEEAFIAGLLQGIGLLALVQELGATYAQFIDHVMLEGGDLAEQETGVLGFNHIELSAQMLAHWGLPAALVRLVETIHPLAEDTLTETERLGAEILQLANLATEYLLTGQPSALLRTLDAAGRLQDISREEVRAMLVELEAELAAQSEVFSIQPPEKGRFEMLAAEAYQRLSELSTGQAFSNANTKPEIMVLEVAAELRNELRKITQAMQAKLPLLKPPATPRSTSLSKNIAKDYPAFASRVGAAVARCRNQRCSLSLVLITLGELDESASPLGPETVDRLVAWLRKACVMEAERADRVIAVGENCLALLLEDCNRSDSVATAKRIVERTRRRHTSCAEKLRLSAGVATLALPPHNFPERELIDTASRCLHAAQSSGGNSVKSFEL